MNRYINPKYLFALLAVVALAVSGCYEEPDWVAENTTPGRGSFPVIATFTVTNGTVFKPGETVQLDLRYWSDDPISQIILTSNIDGTREQVASFGYTPNFAEDSQTDKLLMEYTIPDDIPETVATISLIVEIINENTLSRQASATVELDFPPVCEGVATLAGEYLAVTMATTPFDGAYDNSAAPYTVTITEIDANTFMISDITGGLYGEFYAGIYSQYNVQELPAELTRSECEVSATDVPEDPGFEAVFGPNFLDATGTIAADGAITIDYTNDVGDVGRTVLTPQ